MRIYTNIPLGHPCLKRIERTTGKRHIVWMKPPVASFNLREQFRDMRWLSDFCVREHIPFLAVGIEYEFEDHVDHNDLYAGRFTCCENLHLLGFLPNIGLFDKRKQKTREHLLPHESGMNYVPEGELFNTLLGYIPELIPSTKK